MIFFPIVAVLSSALSVVISIALALLCNVRYRARENGRDWSCWRQVSLRTDRGVTPFASLWMK